jgi:hypothetical protein
MKSMWLERVEKLAGGMRADRREEERLTKLLAAARQKAADSHWAWLTACFGAKEAGCSKYDIKHASADPCQE